MVLFNLAVDHGDLTNFFFEINFRKISEILSEEYPEIRRVWKVLVLLRVRYFKREQTNYYLLFLLRNYWENW